MNTSQQRYETKNLVQFKFALNRKTDGDLIDWLRSPAVPNFRRLVIQLLREEKKQYDKKVEEFRFLLTHADGEELEKVINLSYDALGKEVTSKLLEENNLEDKETGNEAK